MNTRKMIRDLVGVKTLLMALLDVFSLMVYFENLRNRFFDMEERQYFYAYFYGGFDEERRKRWILVILSSFLLYD